MQKTNHAPTIIPPNEGTKLQVMGDDLRIILRAEDTGGRLAVVQQRSQPGAGIPLHINTREDEVFQVLDGRVEFQVGDQTVTAEPGAAVFVPKHTPHSFRIVGTAAATLQIMMLPGGLEKMVEQIANLPQPPAPEQLTKICHHFGVQFLGHRD